jgi:hypothetical protein
MKQQSKVYEKVKILMTFVFLILGVTLLSINTYSDQKLILFFGNIISLISLWFFSWMFNKEMYEYHQKNIIIYYSLTSLCFVIQQGLYM